MTRYRNEYNLFLQNLNKERLRVALILAIVLVPSFALLDYLVHPAYFRTFASLRLGCSVLSIVLLALSYTRLGTTYAMELGFFSALGMAVMLARMIQHLGYESPYYAGFNLIILSIGVILPWGVIETLVASLFIYGVYLIPILMFNEVTHLQPFLNNNIFLLGTILIVATGNYFASSMRRREFMVRFQLEEARAELEQSYQRLQEADQLKSRFFANISHELRTPLTLLMGPAEVILHREVGKITKKQEQYVQMIQTHSTRLLRLINNLLNLSKVDAEKAKLSLTQGNFVRFVRQIVQSVIPLAEQKLLTVSFEGDETIPAFLYDAEKIEDILLNLLSNALKFTESGGIAVWCIKEGEFVMVRVVDTGIGIPEESIPKLFSRFFQVDTNERKASIGTGIGLALVKEWVELHEGRVGVTSVMGKGSEFFFTIPIRIGKDKQNGNGNGNKNGNGNGNGKDRIDKRAQAPVTLAQLGLSAIEETPKWQKVTLREGAEHILIIDDNPDMRHFIGDQLQGDYNLIFAKNGEEGVALALSEHPNLILSDIMMPVKDGYQLLLELKKNPETASIPIIFLTARGDLSDKIEGLEQGADDYLAKPFNVEELRARVCSLLKVQRLQNEVLVKNKRLEEALEEVKRVSRDMIHSEKMSALGVLMAGVAHEMNNPISFAKGSLSVVRNRFEQMNGGEKPLSQEIEGSLDIIEKGLERAEEIVRNLSWFIRKDDRWTSVDLHASLESTLQLLYHKLKDRIEVHRLYEKIPPIEAIPGQINQAFMNILLNAIQAIDREGKIWITTRSFDTMVVISICDNGVGIPESEMSKVMDPFFTTREVGKGPGLGMAITNMIIVESHHGKINIKSRVGEGTEVMMTLPVTQATQPKQ